MAVSRREFLRRSAMAVAVAAVPTSVGCSSVGDDQGLSTLAADFDGQVLLPGDPGFSAAAWPNNANYADVVPTAVANCASVADISRCLRWVRETDSVFAIRSGGHNYAGFSTTVGLLIDVRYMNAVSFDPGTGLVRVGAGANNADVANVLRVHGVSMASGRCPTVGISGLVLGGGWGFSATRHGPTCDSLVATDVVLADTSVVRANEKEHADLFWGLRGAAGGNLGVNSSFTIQTYAAPDVTVFDLTWPATHQVELMYALQTLQIDNPRTLSTRSKVVATSARAKPGLADLRTTTTGLYWGSKRDFLEILQPVLAIAKLNPAADQTGLSRTERSGPLRQPATIREMSYWEARDFLVTDDPQGLYVSKNRFVGERMSAEGLTEMLGWMKRWPGSVQPQLNMGLFFAFGGAVHDVAADATAFVHRNANFLFQVEPEWTPLDSPKTVAAIQSWLTEYVAAMTPYLLPQSYQNFPDATLTDSGTAYYGSNLPRLRSIKKKYDPDNLFRFAQSIPL
ncbi:MAG: FAD-binding oxidoreductase [Thermoleophilia bacterium]|nr:FAD-binding oxidoreductase [Thermoleophilia bacterium]